MPSVDRPILITEYAGQNPKVAAQIRTNLKKIISCPSVMNNWGKSVRIPLALLSSETSATHYRFRFNQPDQLYFGMGDSTFPLPVGTIIDSETKRKNRKLKLDEDALLFSSDDVANMVFQGMGVHSKKEKKIPRQESFVSTGETGRRGLPFHSSGLKRQILNNMIETEKQKARLRKRVEDAVRKVQNQPVSQDTQEHKKTRTPIPRELADLRTTPPSVEEKQEATEMLALAVPIVLIDARKFSYDWFTIGLSDDHKEIVRADVIWYLRYLKTKYKRVEPIYIVHANESREVASLDEAFAYQPDGIQVGPQYLGYASALQSIMNHNIDANVADIYPLDFTSGITEDFEDTVESVIAVDTLRSMSARTAVTIIRDDISYISSLEHSLVGIGALALPNVVVARIESKEGVLSLLRMQLPEQDESDYFQQEYRIAR